MNLLAHFFADSRVSDRRRSRGVLDRRSVTSSRHANCSRVFAFVGMLEPHLTAVPLPHRWLPNIRAAILYAPAYRAGGRGFDSRRSRRLRPLNRF
jgi:hypothetical protein